MQTELIELGGPAHGGYCVGRLASGKVVMVRGGLPGETVEVEVTSERSKVAYGWVVRVKTASADRVAHIWPEGEAKDLGGVELGHIAYPAQLRWKRDVVRDAIRRNGSPELLEQLDQAHPGWEVESLGPEPGRTRVSFTVSEGGGLGMYEAAAHNVHTVRSFPLMVPELVDLDLFRRHWEFAPGTRLRVIAPSSSAPVLFVDGQTFSVDGEPTTSRVRETVSVGDRTFTYRIFAGSFWQTDRRAPATLAAALLDAIGGAEGFDVWELYSGSGLFSLFLAEAVGAKGRLTTVEGDGPATKSAAYNLAKAGFEQVEVQRGNVSPQLLRSLPLGEMVSAGTLVVADPPRSGLGKAVARTICQQNPDLVALFSCDPVSCARDLETMRQLGYRVKTWRAFDLFPYTSHVESLCLLSAQVR